MRTDTKKHSGSDPNGYRDVEPVEDIEVEFGRPEAMADEEFSEADEAEERRLDPLRR